ncbi:hypothetical protein N9J72_00120 [Candidatus Gracilibacteria bacterium]|nr:hypothetical protein [Candidatus Gracilibacteria bacterium]
MDSTKFEINISGEKIHGTIDNPGNTKLMILVPGFIGNSRGPGDIFIELSKELQSINYSVLRFDFRGTPPSE